MAPAYNDRIEPDSSNTLSSNARGSTYGQSTDGGQQPTDSKYVGSTASQQVDPSKANSTMQKTQASTTSQGTTQVSSQKMSALDRLKQVQQIFKQTWQGILTEYTGRPGTSQMCNTKRIFAKPEQLKIEEDRSHMFEQIFNILQNIENDNITMLLSSGQERQSRTAQNFFNKNKQFDV